MFFLEKVTQLEERNFVLQTDKEEKENQLEELSKTNQNLQSEIKELKDALSQMEAQPELNSNGMNKFNINFLVQKLPSQDSRRLKIYLDWAIQYMFLCVVVQFSFIGHFHCDGTVLYWKNLFQSMYASSSLWINA